MDGRNNFQSLQSLDAMETTKMTGVENIIFGGK
jgi:hypothetical protein